MLEEKNNRKAWLYLLPLLFLLAIFSFYPILRTFIVAFIKDYKPADSHILQDVISFNFTLDNFKAILKDELFSLAVKNTLLIAFVSVPISLLLSLVISVLLVNLKKLKGFFQTLFFLPYVTSAMAVAMAFTVLFVNPGDSLTKNPSPSPFNSVVEATGLKDPLIKMFDYFNWNNVGRKEWYINYCHYIDIKGDVYEYGVENDWEENVDWDIIKKDYKSFVKYYANAEEKARYTDSSKSEQELLKQYFIDIKIGENVGTHTEQGQTKYNQCRYKFKTLGYIDWMGINCTYETCIFIVLVYSIWAGLAFKILVFTGGLTGIDKQYYDAAKIDGTSKWRIFWRITVPLISPLIVYLLTTSFIGSFKTYTSIVGLFGETMGPNHSMTTFVGLTYQYLKDIDMIRYAAASSLILFVIIFTITKVLNKLTEKRVHY